MNKLDIIIDEILYVYENPRYTPHDGITYCNMAVHYIASQCGFGGFKTTDLANDMYDTMIKSDDWIKVEYVGVHNLNNGMLCIAAQKGDPHGHIVVLRPGVFVKSAKWEKKVPKCLNIGKTNFIDKGVNYAFEKPPHYFVYTGV